MIDIDYDSLMDDGNVYCWAPSSSGDTFCVLSSGHYGGCDDFQGGVFIPEELNEEDYSYYSDPFDDSYECGCCTCCGCDCVFDDYDADFVDYSSKI